MPAISIESSDEWELVIFQSSLSPGQSWPVMLGRHELPQQFLVFFVSQAIDGLARGDPFEMGDLVVRLELAFAEGLHVPEENHLRLALSIVGCEAREACDHCVVTGLLLDLA